MNTRQKIAIVSTAAAAVVSLVWVEARRPTGPVQTILVAVERTPTTNPAPQIAPMPVAPAPFAQIQPVPPADPVAADGSTRHVAVPGETLSSIAADMPGPDNQTKQAALINANPSLQTNPDKLIAGKTYRIPPVADAAPVAPAVPVPSQAVKPDVNETADASPKELKYTAKPGDTVAALAGAFLGDDGREKQSAIVEANPSLQRDPDKVVAGNTYRIPAPDGLSAAVAPRPTTQPDADQLVADAPRRTLRYTARPGDTVTTLAVQLLGSDTPEARDTIINSNPSLKENPDRLIAGQTYRIPAPSAGQQ